MDIPKTVDDLKWYIANHVQESLHLEYKESKKLNNTNTISKDVSAFANSDGGLIIYGIQEENHLPIWVDEGIDHSVFSKERLENVITSNVAPKIAGLTISRIALSESNSVYSIAIPKSHRGPHQDRHSKKYYRRHNFKSEPMEDYEINDVRNRMETVPPLVNVDIEIKHGSLISIVVSNIGSYVARNVQFSFSPELHWLNNSQVPSALKNGIEVFPPGRVFKYYYQNYQEVFVENSTIPRNFAIDIEYNHCLIDQPIREKFQINLEDYMDSAVVETDLYELGKKITESSNKLVAVLQKLNGPAENIRALAGPTGLDLSFTTLRNLQHILSKKEELEKIDPHFCSQRVFKEVLGVDRELAYRLCNYFSLPNEKPPLAELEGMNSEILSKIQLYFSFEDSKDS